MVNVPPCALGHYAFLCCCVLLKIGVLFCVFVVLGGGGKMSLERCAHCCWPSTGGCRPLMLLTRWSGLVSVLFLALLFDGTVVAGGAVKATPLEMIEEQKGEYIGCFKERIDLYDALVYAGNADGCVDFCEGAYFRYGILSSSKCACSTEFDESSRLESTICHMRCKRNKAQFCGGIDAQSYYATAVKVSGPPTNLRVLHMDETTMSIYWNDPPQPSYVTHFNIKARITETFATHPLSRLSEWTVDNDERHFDLINLHPGTTYNITVTAMCEKTDCGTARIQAETLIGKPDPLPGQPAILEHNGTTMKVSIPEATNNNGPVTNYRLVVSIIDDTLQYEFNESFLGSYNRSVEDGIPYYITAQFPYQSTFVIGDGKVHGDFYNAPLPPNSHIHASLGIVSVHKGILKTAYAVATHEQHTHQVTDSILSDDIDETSVVALSVACVIFGLLLIVSFIVYGYLRFKTSNRPHRLSDNHELTLQGPMVEVENNGYVPDNKARENFKDELNSMLENLEGSQKFARNAIRLNIDDILAQGNYGDVISGRLQSNGDTYDCQVHVISDDIESEDQTMLLKELNQMIQLMPHDRFLMFMGVSASADWFYLIFELPPMFLKKRLVEARVPPSVDMARFSAISEEMILQWVYDISAAMEYMEANHTVHRKLCSYNIFVTSNNQIKLSIFGPPRLADHEKQIDIARWMAPEVLRFQHHTSKSDVWSFACIAWECCTLGATLYANITSQDLLPRIKNGLRPEQPTFIYNDLYQLFLNCWQLEPSERPDFEEIAFNVRQALTSPRHCLSYDRIDNVLIPYYLPLLEVQN